MHECIIDYDACLSKVHHRQALVSITTYFEQRGATISSNVFNYETISLGESVFDNLLMIIKSAKSQGFEKVNLNIRQEIVKYYLKTACQLMVLEQVVIETAEIKENVCFTVYFPEALWIKASCGNARARTSLNSKYMDKESLSEVEKCCKLPNRNDSQMKLLKLSLDLDD
jgi:hypothetical protein